MSGVDPATMNWTISTLNDLSGNSTSGRNDNGETVVTSTAGTMATTPVQTSNDVDTSTWNLKHSVVALDSVGNPVAAPTSMTDVGRDTQTLLNGVVTDSGGTETVTDGQGNPIQSDFDLWSAQQKQLLLDYQEKRGLAVGALLSATAAQEAYRKQWFGVDFIFGNATSNQLAQDVQAAQAAVDQLDAELAEKFGFTASEVRLRAGDAARQWDYGTKFLKALQYGYTHGQFTGEMKSQMDELMQTLQDPQALAQFILIMGGIAALKKTACKAGLTPVAGALFTAKEAADVILTLSALKSELDGVTYESEVANAAPQVTKFMVELSKQISFAELMKLLKCFPAGTQVVVATEQIDGRWRYRTVAIETLNAGDLVLAREEYGPQVKLQRIEETFVRVSDHLRVLEFRDATGRTQTIKTTDEHPFWSLDQARYVLASELSLGARVVGPNEETQTLIASNREEFDRGILVYNFRVAQYHTYYVSEAVDATPLLVHNARYKKSASNEEASGGTYKLKDDNDSVKRTGTTKNLKQREGQLNRHPETKDLNFEVDRRSDDYAGRRGREEIIYRQHPEALKENGGLNKQRAIDPKNPRLEEYLRKGKKL